MKNQISDTIEVPVSKKTEEKAEKSDKSENEIRRQGFIRQLAVTKKPLLSQQKTSPTPLDMTNEEIIAKYIASEGGND